MLVSLVLIFITNIVALFYYQFQLRKEPRVYNFTVETVDLRIKDIEFVVYPSSNSVYVTGHDLENIERDQQFSGIAYGISIGGKSILSLSQADNPFTLPDSVHGIINFNTRTLIRDVKVRNNDTVSIELKYKVNGMTKNLTGTVKLSHIIKPFSSASKNVIRL